MKTLPLFLIAGILVAISGLALTAQFLNRFVILISWGGQVGMSVPTGICFIFTGIAIALIAWEIEKTPRC